MCVCVTCVINMMILIMQCNTVQYSTMYTYLELNCVINDVVIPYLATGFTSKCQQKSFDNRPARALLLPCQWCQHLFHPHV